MPGKDLSNDHRKTTGEVISPTNHDRSKHRDEPIRNPSNSEIFEPITNRGNRNRVITFDSHWFEIFQPITKRGNRSRVISFDNHWSEIFEPITKRGNRNRVITFDSLWMNSN